MVLPRHPLFLFRAINRRGINCILIGIWVLCENYIFVYNVWPSNSTHPCKLKTKILCHLQWLTFCLPCSPIPTSPIFRSGCCALRHTTIFAGVMEIIVLWCWPAWRLSLYLLNACYRSVAIFTLWRFLTKEYCIKWIPSYQSKVDLITTWTHTYSSVSYGIFCGMWGSPWFLTTAQLVLLYFCNHQFFQTYCITRDSNFFYL